MKKEITFVLNKATNEVFYTSSKKDLSMLLECSMSTVMRRYSDAGTYESGVYTIYVSVNRYDNGIETHYHKDVKPPVVVTAIKEQRQETTNNVVIVTTKAEVYSQPIEELTDDMLMPNQYREYYETQSVEELYKYSLKWKYDSKRLAIIKEIGKRKQGIVD